MKYVKRYIILISIALLSFASCIKEVEFTGEETAPLPVLNCVVGDGDTVVYADLSKSLFFLRRGDFAPITDAEVVLTCNGTAYPMTLVGDSVYMLRHTFAAGDVVSISATMPEFGTITSKTITVVPKPAFGLVTYVFESYRMASGFALQIENKNPTNSYYLIYVANKITPDSTEEMCWHWETESYENISCYDSRILLTNSDFPSINEGQYLLFPGRNFSGDTITLKIDFYDTIEVNQIQVVDLYSISEDLYKYLSTCYNYYSSRNNPFTEPVQVYTNISGGLGVLGAKSYKGKNIFWGDHYQP